MIFSPKHLLLLFTIAFSVATLHGQQTDSIACKNAMLYYYTYGSGEPIVLLSGGPGVASHQEDDLAKKLATKYKAILFDQRGTGKSWTKPFDSTTINIETAIADLELLRTTLKISKLNLCGHSWGAMLATAYIAKYPKNVKSVILIGGGELDMRMTEVVDENINTRFQLSDTTVWNYWSDSTNRAKDPARAMYEMRKINWSALTYDRSKLDSILAQATHGSYNTEMNALMWASLRKTNFNPIAQVSKNYKGKALVIFGWQDPIAVITLYMYQQAYPQATIHGINRSGHMPSVEQPEEFYKTIFDFLGS